MFRMIMDFCTLRLSPNATYIGGQIVAMTQCQGKKRQQARFSFCICVDCSGTAVAAVGAFVRAVIGTLHVNVVTRSMQATQAIP